MKPLKLTMTAFGPFRGTAEVDFTAFRNGQFLITGDTGAGKTTIYDAVMFALFEETSNKPAGKEVEAGSVRDKTMLHSKFAPLSVPTEVTLVFEEDGIVYTVKRTISYPKKRGAENEYGDAKFGAELTGDSGLAVEQSGKVTAEIRRIIGMDADQFRQIAMLAQGEFKAFLESRDSARKDILGKIFNSGSYARVMQLLLDAKKQLTGRQLDERKRCATLMEGFPLPEGLTEEQQAGFCADSPNLMENIRALIEEEQAAAQQQEQRENGLQELVTSLRGELSEAGHRNEELDLLDKLRDKAKELSARSGEMQSAEQKLKKTERAVHQVLPKEDVRNAESGKLDILRQKKTAADEALTEAEEQAKAAAEAVKTIPDRTAERDDKSDGAAKIEASYPDYDRLDSARAELRAAQKKKDSAETEKAAAEKDKSAAEAALESITAALQKLTGAETDEAEARHAKAEAESLVEKLTGEDGLVGKASALPEKKKKLTEAMGRSLTASEKKQAADREYSRVNNAYLSSQASFLADELRQEIESSGTAVCKVCGSSVCRDHIGLFATAPENRVDKAAVDAAREEAAQADSVLSEAREALGSLRAEWDTDIRNLCARADELLPQEESWTPELLMDGETLSAAVGEKKRLAAAAAEALKTATKAVQEKQSLTEQKTEQQQLREEAERRISSARETVSAAEAELNQNKKTVEELKRLKFADKKSAEEAVEELKKEIAQADAEILAIRETNTDRQTALAEAKKTAELLRDNITAQREALAEAESNLSAALTAAGFADEEVCRAVLPALAREQYEEYLGAERSRITDYKAEMKENTSRLQEQERKTESYERADLEELSEKVNAAAAELNDLRKSGEQLRGMLRLHEEVCGKLTGSLEKQQRLEAAGARVRLLSDTANGSSGEGGKHSFDGYVLGIYFEEILSRATEHLNTMTGGRYTLVHQDRGRHASSAADFVIHIVDNFNGEQREIGSISGGEGFQVSMALALGLSDVAQAHATGGRRIEAMFIDEGFGTLDARALTGMITALRRISGDSRLIGMISHVDSLEEYIPDKICVRTHGDDRGSYIVAE